MAPWQRITVYRYTLPSPYELATENLFEELGYPFNAGHAAPSMTCREGLTTLPGHGQCADL